MTPDNAIRDFAMAGNELPRASMQWALDHWDEAGPRLLALLEAYASGADTSERTEQAMFLALHLLAGQRETAAFGPLCRLLADAETVELILGDALTVTLPGLLISTFDGDAAALRHLVETEQADEFVRESALLAFAYLTRIGVLPAEETQSFLRHLLTAMQPQAEHVVWIAWVLAVACLGDRDLAGDAEALIRRGFVPRDVMHVSHFREDLRRTLDDPAGMAGFAAARIGPFTDAIGELAQWTWSNEDGELDDPDPEPQEPTVNPLRGVGRNDPCPCGSGKKFKKCCLE